MSDQSKKSTSDNTSISTSESTNTGIQTKRGSPIVTIANGPPSDTSNSSVQENRQLRTEFTPEQIRILEAEYAKDQYAEPSKRLALGEKLKLSEKTIRIWFQNRRQKNKKERSLYLQICSDPNTASRIQNELANQLRIHSNQSYGSSNHNHYNPYRSYVSNSGYHQHVASQPLYPYYPYRFPGPLPLPIHYSHNPIIPHRPIPTGMTLPINISHGPRLTSPHRYPEVSPTFTERSANGILPGMPTFPQAYVAPHMPGVGSPYRFPGMNQVNMGYPGNYVQPGTLYPTHYSWAPNASRVPRIDNLYRPPVPSSVPVGPTNSSLTSNMPNVAQADNASGVTRREHLERRISLPLNLQPSSERISRSEGNC